MIRKTRLAVMNLTFTFMISMGKGGVNEGPYKKTFHCFFAICSITQEMRVRKAGAAF